jgi:hypothetical protein
MTASCRGSSSVNFFIHFTAEGRNGVGPISGKPADTGTAVGGNWQDGIEEQSG